MAYTATYDKTANTFARDYDQKLWAALQAKHPLLDLITRPSIIEPQYSWEVDQAITRTYVSAAGTDIDGSETTTALVLTGGGNIALHTILRNATRPSPVASATYKNDELLEVTANDGAGVLAVARNIGVPSGSTAGHGYASHVEGDTFEVVYQPKAEGSAMEENKYKDVVLVTNYTTIIDHVIEVTGSQMAARREVAADNLANQTAKANLNAANDLERLFLYGVVNATTAGGSATQVRRSKGLDQYITAAGGNVDYATGDVTATALNTRFYNILANKTDPTDRFVIVTHPFNAKKISHFGDAETIVNAVLSTKYGRQINTFMSDMGVTADVIWTLNCSPSDLFIIDLNKVAMPVYRPFVDATVTYATDGTDAWRQRSLTEIGVKVVDPLYSYGKLAGLPWS